MKKFLYIVLIFIAIGLYAKDTPAKIVYTSAQIMKEIMKTPDRAIPDKLLKEAKAIAIIPHVVKVGFVIGGKYGEGILTVKEKNGNWSAPVFIKLVGGSIGWQIGAQASDIILVFTTRRGVDGIVSGKFTLGADASVAAGPVGRNALAATDATLNSEIYSYSRSKGLFAGVSLDGSAITVNDELNKIYYKKDVSPTDIFKRYHIVVPESAEELIKTVSKYTR